MKKAIVIYMFITNINYKKAIVVFVICNLNEILLILIFY